MIKLSDSNHINVSVIIPTYNRSKILLKTLKALENQNYPKSNYQVVIADDGSTDNTSFEIRDFQKKSDLRIKYIKLSHVSSCHARNAALTCSDYELILSIDDDIVTAPDFISEHARIHKEYSYKRDIIVSGYIKWPDAWRASSFMKYIAEKGPLYGYGMIKNELDLPFAFLYSANFSIHKSVLIENGMFDERFSQYFEDSELGFRLKKKGLKIILNKKAAACHFHRVGIFSFLKRQELAGYSAVKFYLKCPELKNFLFPGSGIISFYKKGKLLLSKFPPVPRILYSCAAAFIEPIKLIRYSREVIYSLLLSYAYGKGLRKGLDEYSA